MGGVCSDTGHMCKHITPTGLTMTEQETPLAAGLLSSLSMKLCSPEREVSVVSRRDWNIPRWFLV